MPINSASIKLPAAILSLILIALGSLAQEEQVAADPASGETLEAVTRLQVFLDRAEFSPGKIDGRMGQFTLEALALYREAHGGAATPDLKADALPELDDLDLATVDPLFLSYEVSEADLRRVGELPGEISEQSKLKAMPYRSAAEAIAEKFHMDEGYLHELNPGKTKNIKKGDSLRVVNVAPFEKEALEKLRPETADGDPPVAGKDDEAGSNDTAASDETKVVEREVLVHINTDTNMLTLYESDKLVAAYPVTVGSEQTESPLGEWKVTRVSVMPNFRHDKSMLKKGVRSDDFHMLPPGPNNPVGVMWIQLNKKGIGIHGTSDPDTIGRSSSHGCVRLANWDVVRFAERIGTDVPVTIKAGPR